MKDLINKAINESGADYLEIRIEEWRRLNITYRGKDLDEFSNGHSVGGHIRALVNGGWGTASFTDMNSIPQLCKSAERAARLIANGKFELAPIDVHIEKIVPEMKTDPRDIPVEDKEELVRRYNNIIMSGEKIQSSIVHYSEEILDKALYTSEGTAIEEESVNMSLSATAMAREGSLIQSAHEMDSSALDFNKLTDMDKRIEEVVEKSTSLLKAQPAKPGKFDIVIDPRLTGVFVHEAFGHLSEADFVSQNDNLKDVMKLERQFGTEHLNIIDDGSPRDLPGCSRFDDEGTKTRKNYLIKEGRLVGRLHNRETASRMNEEVSGNARAVNFFYEPVVRMTCTYLDGGDWDRDEMIGDIEKGYYVRNSKGGQTNLEMFTFSGEDAFLIENGEITEQVRDLNLSGNLFETLHQIDAIGSDLEIMRGGYCGKGEHYPLPVSYGGPHIRIRNIVIGGG